MENKLKSETLEIINRLLKQSLTDWEDRLLRVIKYGNDELIPTYVEDYRKVNSAYENFEDWWDEYVRENGEDN